MATSISLTYYGVAAEGATVKEAKANAGRVIERVMREYGQPRFIVAPNGAACVWFSPAFARFEYAAAASVNELIELMSRASYYHGDAGTDERDAIKTARRRAAEYGLDARRPETYAEACHYLRTHGDRDAAREIQDNLSWQLAYIEARGAGEGCSDPAWHAWACAHAGEFRDRARDICADVAVMA